MTERTDRPPRAAKRPGGQRRPLTREKWIAAALEVFEKKGIAAVKIDALAKRLRVTRGSFYFHFAGLGDLHQSLLNQWRDRNCAPFAKLAAEPDLDGLTLFSRVVRTWVDEAPFRPLLDLAVRDWGRGARPVANEVAAADEFRISLLARAFRAIGYSDDESVVRARITYLHQIGYYALPFKETAAERTRYQPIYGRVLLGPLIEPEGDGLRQQAAAPDYRGRAW